MDSADDSPGPSQATKRVSRPVSRPNMLSVDLALDPDELARERRKAAGSSDDEMGSEFEVAMRDEEDGEVEEAAGSDEETDAEEEYEHYINAEQPHYRTMEQTMMPPPPPSSKRKGKQRAIDPDDVDLETGEGFDRLLSAIQQPEPAMADAAVDPELQGFQRLGPAWDQSIENELAEIDLEATQSKKEKKKNRKKGGGRNRQPLISTEVQALLGQANLAYVSAEREKAIEILQEIIRIEPGIIQPWETLSAIHTELHEAEKALQFRVIAAHLQPKNVENWKDIASVSRQHGLLSQAIYCYTQASRADRDDVDALWDRAFLHREMGNHRRSAATLKQILRILPHDPYIVRNLMLDYMAFGNLGEACQVGQSCLSFQRYDQPHGPARNAAESAYSLEDIITLATLQVGMHRYTDAIRTIKTGVRWMQGREDEVWWDVHPDDREYDVVREEGRMPPSEHMDAAGVNELDLRLRLALGQARINGTPKEKKEAKRHFDVCLGAATVEENPQVHGDVADAYFDRRLWGEAVAIFLKMAENEAISSTLIYVKIGTCYRKLNKLEDAISVFEAVVNSDEEDLDSKLALAELYEATNKRDLALALVNDVIERRGERGMDDGNLGDFLVKQRQLTASRQQQLSTHTSISRQERIDMERELQEDVLRAFKLLAERETKVDEGDVVATREWIDIAAFLVDNFRENKQLFPHDQAASQRYKASVASQARDKTPGNANSIDAAAIDLVSRIQRSMVQDQSGEGEDAEVNADSFRGVTFDRWTVLTVKYTFLLAKRGELDEAVEVLQHMQTSILRLTADRMRILRFALISVALYHRNFNLAVDEVRKFLLAYSYQNAPLRLMQAITPHGIVACQVASGSNHQKFIMRQMKLIDGFAAKQEALAGAAPRQRDGDDGDGDGDGEEGEEPVEPEPTHAAAPTTAGDFEPTKRNPAYLEQYGMLMAGSRSFQASIIYQLRAHELAPNDPMICLGLGVGYFHRAMQRQTDNRHHQLSQGLAFFGRYRKLRGPCQEVEYNIGRAYHGIGLVDSAIKQYESVLEMETEHRLSAMSLDDDATAGKDHVSFAKEAAYNLQLLYMTTNNRDFAREVARKWLTL